MVRDGLRRGVRAAMKRAARLDDRVGLAVVFTLGGGGVLAQAVHAAVATSTRSVLVGIVPPLLVSAAIVAIGVWLTRSELREHALRIGGWCLLGSALFVVLQVLYISYQTSAGGRIVQPFFDVVGSMTIGTIVGLLLGVYDARRERAQHRLEEGREQVVRLNQRLRVLNRVLRHDIRNDVNVIEAQVQDLGEAEDVTRGPQPVRTIRRKSEAILRRSERARDIERMIDANEVATEPTDVADVLSTAIERLRHTHPAATVDADVPATAPARASPLIDSAIRNVLENAIEHHDGTPTVSVSLTEREGEVEIRIADDGPGIPEREVEVLESGEETPVRHASGLGLWLTNWIVEESGGEVRFEPNEPRGSVVVIELPRPEA